MWQYYYQSLLSDTNHLINIMCQTDSLADCKIAIIEAQEQNIHRLIYACDFVKVRAELLNRVAMIDQEREMGCAGFSYQDRKFLLNLKRMLSVVA